jgi:hypothetical protein
VLDVLRSTPQFAASPTGLQWTSNGFAMQVGGLSGHGLIVLYVSTNLVDWQPILTNAPVTGSLPFLDLAATNQNSRFYRVVEE